MKILVVDDSKAMRMIISRALHSSPTYRSAEILQAEDGRAALALVRTDRPDVVLSDWNMPTMSGIELLDTLRAEGDATPLGFITSESTPEMYERAVSAGAAFLVTKPFTGESLAKALAEAA